MNAIQLRIAANETLEQINFGLPVSHEYAALLAEHVLETVAESDSISPDLQRVIDEAVDNSVYARACRSMASQFICPKMTGRELAESQLKGHAKRNERETPDTTAT